MWSFILFGISVLGMMALILFKNWELRRGTIPGGGLRATTDARVVVVTGWMKLFPRVLKERTKVVLAYVIFHTSAIMLRIVHFVERKLIRIINLVKGRGDINTKKGAASFFLQNVSTYKEAPPTVESQ